MLIAFLLSTVLIVGYQVFYYAPRVRQAQEQKRAELAELAERAVREPSAAVVVEADSESVAEAEPSLVDSAGMGVEAPAPEGELPIALRANVRLVHVRTPLFTIGISTAGAEIVSVALNDYLTRGEPVELVRSDPVEDRGVLAVRLVGEDQQTSLSRVLFEPYIPGAAEPLGDRSVFTVDESTGEQTLLFRAEGVDGRRIERMYTFWPASYTIDVGVRYAASNFPFARQIEWGMGPGLTATEANDKEDYDAFRASVRLGDEYHKRKRGDFKEEFAGVVQWTALKTKYFSAILLPVEPSGGEVTLEGVAQPTQLTARLRLPAVERQSRVEQQIGVYLGPLDYEVLKAMGRGLEKNVEVGFDHFKIFQPISRGILWSMTKLYKVIPNYGLIIIIISLLTKVLFYRLTHKSFKSMRDMQALQPKLQVLKEKYKDDRQRLSQETMKLYREAGVNPLGGCLPMLLQMPVFIALFNVLRNTIEVRQAPFFGWINDLSQQDVVATLPFALPIIGNAISVLPILMGASMLVQSKIGGSIAGPESGSTQPKAFVYMMPVIFTVLFYKMPSGLVLYWLVNTVLSVGQQYYINKGAEKEEKGKAEENTKAAPDETPPLRPKQTKQNKRSKVKKG